MQYATDVTAAVELTQYYLVRFVVKYIVAVILCRTRINPFLFDFTYFCSQKGLFNWTVQL